METSPYNIQLESAPKSWYDSRMEVCTTEGFNTEVSDEGLLQLLKDRTIVGVLALHVDDASGGGIEDL